MDVFDYDFYCIGNRIWIVVGNSICIEVVFCGDFIVFIFVVFVVNWCRLYNLFWNIDNCGVSWCIFYYYGI